MHLPAPAPRPSGPSARVVWMASAGGMRVRSYRAADGATATVREAAVPNAPWARGPRCLLFECEGAVRRVWQYPADWHEASDAALDALSWGR